MAAGRAGALVISLDFELHWGVRDHRKLDKAERERLLAARQTVPQILRAFADHSVSATWATVGLLFARSREEAQACRPELMPRYEDVSLDPYAERVGRDEAEDPFHFAPSLIRTIREQEGQEVASHSYSHYYSLEAGQGDAEFKSDVASARRIAENSGYCLTSYVFPRNQVRGRYLPILHAAGFASYRGNEPATAKAPVPFREQRKPWRRAQRLLDSYWDLNGSQTVAFPENEPLASVGASRYLRPFSPALQALEGLRLQRIQRAMTSAAREKRIFHLWWHPEDFASHPQRNIDFLRRVLGLFNQCRRDYGMTSLSMAEVSSMPQEFMAASGCGAIR